MFLLNLMTYSDFLTQTKTMQVRLWVKKVTLFVSISPCKVSVWKQWCCYALRNCQIGYFLQFSASLRCSLVFSPTKYSWDCPIHWEACSSGKMRAWLLFRQSAIWSQLLAPYAKVSIVKMLNPKFPVVCVSGGMWLAV